MTDIIKIRRTTTAAKVPTTADLADGEVGINLVDGKIYQRSGSTIYLVGEKNAAAGSGTVTSVAASGSTGLTVSGSPITTNGTLTFTLSTNLQGWSGISPSTKADDANVVHTTGTETVAGAKTFTSNPVVSNATPRVVLDDTDNTTGAGFTVNSTTAWVYGTNTNAFLIRPLGQTDTTGEFRVNAAYASWNGNIIYHAGNLDVNGLVHTTGDESIGGTKTITGSNLQFSVGNMLATGSNVDFRMRALADGTGRASLQGGASFSVAEGAYFYVSGNNHATTPGLALLRSGNGANIELQPGSGGIVNITQQLAVGVNSFNAILLGTGGSSVGATSTGSAVLAGNSNTVALRPNGYSSTTGQLAVETSGNVSVAGDLSVSGTISGYMPTSWTITAGNGMSGGGTGAANRTLTLGTPSSITGSSTNSVTSTSHTHALSVDSTAVPMKAATFNADTTIGTTHLNTVVEKTSTSNYTYTIPSSLGTRGDCITFVNSSSGVMTIARGSGTGIYRNGTNADISLTTGSMCTLYKANAAGRWIAG